MSKKQNTPEYAKAPTNFYITPIKKQRIKFTNENYINNDNRNEENCLNNNPNLNLNSNFINNQNEIYNRSNNSNLGNKTEEKNFITSTYEKCFKSPFSNFLFHSPASFENYLECFSRKKINVLNLINKNKCGLNEQKEINLQYNNAINPNNEIDKNFYFNAYAEDSTIDYNQKQVEILRTPINNARSKKRKINSDLIYSSDKSNFSFYLLKIK